ncbi:MAG: porin [Solirubrobacterales bacterium]
MKKLLIAGTALVAAGTLPAGPASASDKIKIDLGGYSKWWVVGQWQDKSYESNLNTVAPTATSTPASGLSPTNVDIKGDNEIWFTGETTLNNGMKVGVTIELEAGGNLETNGANGNTMDVIDQSYAYIEGGFGKVMLGTASNGTVLLHVMAPDAASNWGNEGMITGGSTVVNPGLTKGANMRTTTELDTDDNAEKITYVSPTFHGLTVGGSYIPNALAEDDRNVGSTIDPISNNARDVSAYGVGALYDRTFGEVGLKVSAGTIWYDVGAGTGRSIEWSAGTQLSYAGFTLGGAYRKINRNDVNLAALGGTSTGSGQVWDAGLQYASGNYAVSVAYLHSESVGNNAVAGNDKLDIYQVSGKYALGPGVDILASAGHLKYADEVSAPANDNQGWTVMTGLSLTF